MAELVVYLVALNCAFSLLTVGLLFISNSAIRHLIDELVEEIAKVLEIVNSRLDNVGIPEDFNPVQAAIAQLISSKVSQTPISRDDAGQFREATEDGA